MATSPSATKKEEDRSESGNNDSAGNDSEVALTPVQKIITKSASFSALEGVSNMPWETPVESDEIPDQSSNVRFKTPTGDIASNDTPWKTPDQYADKDTLTSTENPGESETLPFKTPTGDIASNDTPWKTTQQHGETENLPFHPGDNNDVPHSPLRSNINPAEATPIVSNAQKSSIRKSGLMRRRSDSNGVTNLERKFEKSVSFKRNPQNVKHDIVVEDTNDDNDDEYGQFSSEDSPKLGPQKLDQAGNEENRTEGEDDQEELEELLSLPDLKLSSKKISFANRPSHKRFNSNISEISLDSVGDDMLDDPLSGFDNNQRLVEIKKNRRLSLTADIETGRSPNLSSKTYYRGQQAIRRVSSNEMMTAQSPRSRRRRTVSYNMEQFRKNLGNRLSLPSPRSMTDLQNLEDDQNKVDIESQQGSKKDDEHSLSDHSLESLRQADRNRRKRYDVEQVQILNSERSRNSSVPSQVQYRLSAITPIELRRRRYRNSLRSPRSEDISVDASGKSQETKNGVNGGCVSPDNRCNRCIMSLGNFFIEVVIYIVSKGKENYSVGVINRVLYWSFRKNLIIVLLSAACSFYVMTVVFAVLIYIIGLSNPQCIHVNGVDFGDTRNRFVDAFALSWTTFTTVGYGLVFPGTSATMENSTFATCTGMGIITTFEAFIGILFSGFWGAIWFAKVTRVSSFAQVSFSEWVVIKYGTGVMGAEKDEEYEEGSSDEEVILTPSERNKYKQSKLPPPIFEFRIVNRLNRQRGGEIIDAYLNIVASMEESQATRTVQNGAGMAPMIRRKGRRPKRNNYKNYQSASGRSLGGGEGEEEKEKKVVDVIQLQDAARSMVSSFIDSENNRDNSRSVNKSKIPNQIFAKLHVESMEHPFFKRVWNVRHVLDENSPLLKPEAKDLMRANGGHWPEELNNATAVRASIQFDQILVSFSGTSNVDANSVYMQNAYKFKDVAVGYAFCNMLYREANGSIGVDQTLLNDVKEQSGGGGEELHHREYESSTRSIPDIFIL